MADSKTKTETAMEGTREWYNELVSVKLFKDSGKYRDDVFVAVNGKGWQIRRGVEGQVPRYVALVLQQSLEQDAATAELMDRQSAEFRAESNSRGL